MGIIGWIVLGLLAGAIAKLILPGEDPGGLIVTTLIGIAGAIVGGLIASALDIGDIDEFFDVGTWLIAIAGSVLLLLAYRMITGGGVNRGAYRGACGAWPALRRVRPEARCRWGRGW